MRKLAIATVVLFLASIFAAGCNTTKGAGQDLQRGGEKLQGSAERHGAN